MRKKEEKEKVEIWLLKKGAIPKGCEKNEYWTYWKKTMQQYADEFACAFAEWIIESKYKLISIKKGIIYSNEDIIKPESVIEFYTTTELLEIFKKEINGKV